MGKAQMGDVVKVDLSAKLDDGTLAFTSKGAEPISFQLGAGEVIPGLETAIIGMTEGQWKTATIPPEDAFGRYSGDRLIVMARSDFPPHIEPCKGQFLRVRKVNGRTGVVRVALADDSRVLLDTNHLLAGQEIILEIELLEVLSPSNPISKAAGIRGTRGSRRP